MQSLRVLNKKSAAEREAATLEAMLRLYCRKHHLRPAARRAGKPPKNAGQQQQGLGQPQQGVAQAPQGSGQPQQGVGQQPQLLDQPHRSDGQKHPSASHGLCQECAELMEYARRRTSLCPHLRLSGEKPFCSACDIHCYSPERRTQIAAVMRFSGPRMLLRRPLLAIRHVLETRKAQKSRM